MRPVKNVTARLVERMLARDLRKTFRRVLWVGDPPHALLRPVAGAPLALYANHHYFHDGYLLWLLIRRHLRRPLVLWMQDWERAPLFAPLGVLPFPADDRAQRIATVRETARRLRDDPSSIFLYFPEGELHPPDAGMAPFDPQRFTRLARRIPENVAYWPVAVHVTWWGEDRPTALLTADAPHDTPDGHERERLDALLARLRAVRPEDEHLTLLEGGPSVHERWDLSPLAPLFKRLI